MTADRAGSASASVTVGNEGVVAGAGEGARRDAAGMETDSEIDIETDLETDANGRVRR